MSLVKNAVFCMFGLSPAYESDPDRPKFVPKERWYAPPAKPPDIPEKEG
jgi:hypothetical protein